MLKDKFTKDFGQQKIKILLARITLDLPSCFVLIFPLYYYMAQSPPSFYSCRNVVDHSQTQIWKLQPSSNVVSTIGVYLCLLPWHWAVMFCNGRAFSWLPGTALTFSTCWQLFSLSQDLKLIHLYNVAILNVDYFIYKSIYS